MNLNGLKNKVLQLAIQGKLVEQNPKDTPASVLLKEIRQEKELLIKEKKIKEEKELPEIKDEEKPFELPNGWEWSKLGSLSEKIHYGYTASAKSENTGVKLLRITDIQNNKVNWDTVPFCEIDDNKLDTCRLFENDILIARTGGTIGKSFIVSKITEISVFASYLIRVKLIKNINPNYIKLFLESPNYWGQLQEKSQGTGQANVNAVSLSNLLIPIPPLEEQECIVKKVYELFAIIDELNENKEGIIKNISDSRNKILQLAIQGKLVEQNPEDTPVEVLLDRIEAEKERLIKDKIIKKEKILSEIIAEEKMFDIPDNWKWVRFYKVIICRDGERIPISSKDRSEREKIYNYYGASGIIDKIDNYIFDKPLLLIGEDGANLISRSTPIAFIAKGKYWVNNHAHVIDSIDYSILKYLEIFINAIDLKPYVTGTAQPKLNQANLNNIVVPFPPLEEQKRIVAKVEKIMNYLDDLEDTILK